MSKSESLGAPHHPAVLPDEGSSVGVVVSCPGPASGAVPKSSRPVLNEGCLSESQNLATSTEGHPPGGRTPLSGDGRVLDSQAPEDQVAIIHEMCRHVEKVMDAFSLQDDNKLPSEASRALNRLKGKMVLFASQSPVHDGSGNVDRCHSTEGSDLSDLGADSESSEVGRRGADAIPKREAKPCSSGQCKGEPGALVAVKQSNLSLEERFIVALENLKLDMRTVPAPEPYDRSSGQSFSSFLRLFEDYCQHSFKGSESLWVAELGRYLAGDMYQAYISHKSPDDSYLEVKTKLLKWYSESKSRREAGSKARFSRASMGGDESVRLYAARLENLFRRAFPGGKVESSKTLLDKFLKSIPRKYRKQVKSALAWAESFGGRSMGWSQVLKLVGGLEEALASDKSSDEEESHWKVMRSSVRPISVGRREASTQYSLTEGDVSVPNSHSNQRPVLSRERSGSSFHPVGFGERERQLATVCHFCGKLGHMQRDCRRKYGLCLVCGSRDHQVMACPRRLLERQNDYNSPDRSDIGDASGTGAASRRVSFGEVQANGESSSLNCVRPAWRESLRK